MWSASACTGSDCQLLRRREDSEPFPPPRARGCEPGSRVGAQERVVMGGVPGGGPPDASEDCHVDALASVRRSEPRCKRELANSA